MKKMTRHKDLKGFAKAVGLDPARALEAEMKAHLTGAQQANLNEHLTGKISFP